MHFFQYASLTYAGCRAYPEKCGAITGLAITLLVGILDESLQSITPARVFDYKDLGLNLVAGIGGLVAAKRGCRSATKQNADNLEE